MGDLVRHAAEQESLRAGHALVADDDQVRLLLLRHVEDGVSRIALAGVGLDLHAHVLEPLGGGRQRVVYVLARIDHPLEVARHLLALIAQASLGHGLVGAHQVHLRTEPLCELSGLPHRLAGGVGAIRTDDHRTDQCLSFRARSKPRPSYAARGTTRRFLLWTNWWLAGRIASRVLSCSPHQHGVWPWTTIRLCAKGSASCSDRRPISTSSGASRTAKA